MPAPITDPATAPLACHLFRRPGTDWFAVTQDKSGLNLPQDSAEPWTYVQSFALGVQHAMPVLQDPEPVLRGLETCGYFLWNGGNVNNDRATSQ